VGGEGEDGLVEARLDHRHVLDGGVGLEQAPQRRLGGADEELEAVAVGARALHVGPGRGLRGADPGPRGDPAAGDEGLDLGGRALGDHPSGVEQDDAVGEGVGLLEVVGGEHDAAPGRRAVPQDGPEGATHLDVEAGGRLVDEEDVGVAAQGDPEQHPALLTAGELAEEAVLEPGEARGLDDRGHRQRRRVVAAELGEELPHPERLRDPRGLQHHAGAGAGGGVARVAPEEPGGAGGRGREPGEHAEGRGLTGAVRAEDGEEFAGADLEVDGVGGGDAAVPLGRAAQFREDGATRGDGALRGPGRAVGGGPGSCRHALQRAPGRSARVVPGVMRWR